MPTDSVFSALSDPSRRRLLETLAARESVSLTELAAQLPVTRQAVSKHLAALAQAGLGWSPAMGQEDPLYKKIDEIVHKILDGFTDNLAIFDELREDLEHYLAEEEKAR